MYQCSVCGYEYDEARESIPFEELSDSWTCPVSNVPKAAFEKVNYKEGSWERRSRI